MGGRDYKGIPKNCWGVGYTDYLDYANGFTVCIFIKVITLFNMCNVFYINYTLTKLLTEYGGEW